MHGHQISDRYAGVGEGASSALSSTRDIMLRSTTPSVASEGSSTITENIIDKTPEWERQALFQNVVNERLGLPTGYNKVAVLVARWDEDIDGFRDGHNEEIRKLRTLFRDRFHYDYEEVHLNTSTRPQHILNHAVSGFLMRHDGVNNLLVVYYTGHGRLSDESGEVTLELTPTLSSPGAQFGRYPAVVSWQAAESPLFNDAEANVLAILDCCFASNAYKGPIARNESQRSYELLAAAPKGQYAVGPGPHSFTTALIQSLKALLEENSNRPFTTAKLVERLNKGSRKVPAMLWDRLGKHECHIQLSPLQREFLGSERSISQEIEQAWVNLRFSLTDSVLSTEQIEAWAHGLTVACEEAKVPVRRIDWIRMMSVPTPEDRKALRSMGRMVGETMKQCEIAFESSSSDSDSHSVYSVSRVCRATPLPTSSNYDPLSVSEGKTPLPTVGNYALPVSEDSTLLPAVNDCTLSPIPQNTESEIGFADDDDFQLQPIKQDSTGGPLTQSSPRFESVISRLADKYSRI